MEGDEAEVTGEPVTIPVDGVTLPGGLSVPEGARGLVVFAHGSGSSRTSPRNDAVARALNDRGLGTLLFDLLTGAEDQHRENRFDVDLLAERLVAATEWLGERDDAGGLPVGYFGSSTGAAAALLAAARYGDDVEAVVSRGGRVDMAEAALDDVTAPTLLIVGGRDTQVLDLNREAMESLPATSALHVVADAGHLFEGPGELEEVAEVAADWFVDHLG